MLHSLSVIVLLLAGPGLAQAVVTIEAGTSAAEVQTIIDSLPADREAVATVKLVGAFEFDRGLVLPSFTRLDLTEARIRLASHTVDALLTNADHEGGNVHIEVLGGRLIGLGPSRHATQGIFFARVNQCRLSGLEVSNFSQDGIRLSGLGQHTRKVFVSDVYCHNNAVYRRGSIVNLAAVGNCRTGSTLRAKPAGSPTTKSN